MRKLNVFIFSLAIVIFSIPLYAGTPGTTIDCKSTSGKLTITGYDRMQEGFDIKIKMDSSTLRYVDACNDVNCTKHEQNGDITIVEALNNKVFTISFTNKFVVTDTLDVFMGYFYALPDTVKYKKSGDDGYEATYKGIYWGADPRSDSVPPVFLDKPVEVMCTQKSAI